MAKYPGLGLPLRYEDGYGEDEGGHYHIEIHESCLNSQSKLVAVREVAMMNVMDRPMDKPDMAQEGIRRRDRVAVAARGCRDSRRILLERSDGRQGPPDDESESESSSARGD